MKKQKFYDVKKNVREYIESCEGKDSRFLIKKLKKHLKPNSAVLELGMGAGFDLDILNENFQATGSDYSQVFLNIYKEKKPDADMLLLDAVTLETKRKFDCIYSNKVLHHLTKENLITSLESQKKLLNENGILFHTFWSGTQQNQFQDLNFIQYEIDELKAIVKEFQIIEIEPYYEMNFDDSIYIILKTN